MSTLKSIVEHKESPWGRCFDLSIQVLIVVSLLAFSIETLPNLSPLTQALLHYLKEEMILFALVAALILYLSAVGIYYFEHEAQPEVFPSVFHSLWWSVCTLTTVGYGDIYPVTAGGKLFTSVVLATGLGIISVPAVLVASALAQAREIETRELKAADFAVMGEVPRGEIN